MRRLVAYELLSLDGVAEEPEDFIFDFDDVMEANLGRVISTQDAVVLGRRTFEHWAAFWPTSDIQPFADFINSVEKYVVASEPPKSPWSPSTWIEGDPVATLRQLKAGDGGDIGLHGSIEVTGTALRAGLVDVLALVIAPVVRGEGRHLLEGLDLSTWRLESHEASPSGHVLLEYHALG